MEEALKDKMFFHVIKIQEKKTRRSTEKKTKETIESTKGGSKEHINNVLYLKASKKSFISHL